MSIVFAHVQIEGNRPLLWHHFGADALPLEKRPKTGVAGNNPEEWKRSVLALNGQFYLEPAYIFGCLRDAAKYTSRRRGTLPPILASTLQVTDRQVWVDRAQKPPASGDLETHAPKNLEPGRKKVRAVRRSPAAA